MRERTESGEENIDESGRNPTQRRMDEEGQSVPVDASWTETPGDSDEPLDDEED